MFTPSKSMKSPDLGYHWYAEKKNVKEGSDFILCISWGKKRMEFI